jgi:hypothetical protein
VSIALSVLEVVYPARFAPHAKFFIGCLYFGVALCVLTALWWLLERMSHIPEKQPEPAPIPSAQSNIEVGHIEQKDIGARASAEFHLHLPPSAPESAPKPESPAPVTSVLPRPHFDIRLAEICSVLLAMDDTMVRFVQPGEECGEKCLALYVINRPAAQGQQTRPARSVFASLQFRSGSRTTDVNRACWIGKDTNEITIGVNETEHILVGLPKESEWVTYHNPNKISVLGTDFWSHRQAPVELEKRTLKWGEGASYTVDVRIICNAPGPFLGETFAHRQFTMERKGISLSAKMLE